MAKVAELFFLFFCGTILGSFANVYFYRISRGLSLFFPRSFCPQCDAPILFSDEVPILSYFILRGRCRYCQIPIARRYPTIEFFCGALFVTIALAMSAFPFWKIALFCVYSFLLFLIGGIDTVTYFANGKKYGTIPDSLCILLAVFGFLMVPINSKVNFSYIFSAISALAAGTGMLLLRWISEKIFKRATLGLADVKMTAALALFLGWTGTLHAFFLACVLGISVIGFGIGTKKFSRESPLPFGPFLSAATFLVLLLTL